MKLSRNNERHDENIGILASLSIDEHGDYHFCY